jgi:hypothetical protein
MKIPSLTLALLALLVSGKPDLKADSTPQEQAEFLAGLPLPPQSPLADAQQGEAYKSHQKELSDKWAFCRKARYEAMRKWGEENLGKVKGSREIVRYLFGGPDFLNAYAFFPNARVMVLGGLEPIGEVPPPEKLKPGMLGQSLASLRQALRTSLYCGYFITSEMGGQLHHGCFRGVLPVLYTELALTGNTVDSVNFEQPFGAPGVRITYHRPGNSEQTLYYFQSNLANGEPCHRFLTWLGTLGEGATYLKAASYLLHGSEFSQTRDFLLGTSSVVVEDDSGIPYRYFAQGGWNIRLFGEYVSPLPIFSGYAQRDFREAYKTPSYAGPISFGAGYHVVPAHANILLATPGAGRPSVVRTAGTGAVKENEAALAESDLLSWIRGARKKDQSQPLAKATPATKPANPPTALPASLPASPASDHRTLAALEEEESRIRKDVSLGKAERNTRLQDVWNRQLVAMGKSPAFKFNPPKASGAPAPVIPLPVATPVQVPVAVPVPSATPVELASPNPESAPTPVPASTPEPVEATPTPSPVDSPSSPAPVPEFSPSAQPGESPQASPSGQG